MTLDHVQFALTALVLLGNLVWYLSAWRAQSDRTDAVIPDLEERVDRLEAHQHDAQALQQAIQDIKARLEVVATRSHETINRMNALPETLSTLFLRKDVADVIIRESAEDRGRLHRKVDDLVATLRRPTIVKKEQE